PATPVYQDRDTGEVFDFQPGSLLDWEAAASGEELDSAGVLLPAPFWLEQPVIMTVRASAIANNRNDALFMVFPPMCRIINLISSILKYRLAFDRTNEHSF